MTNIAHSAHQPAPISSDIQAEMFWITPSSPPEVTLSFQGLAEPLLLWPELTALGWGVPPTPPRPGSAIDWTPDPVAGTEYTIKPWRVVEHRLAEGQWTAEERTTIGALTYHLLRRFDTTITGTTNVLDELNRSHSPQPGPASGTDGAPLATPTPEAIAAQHGAAAAASTGASVLFLGLAQDTSQVTHWNAISGRDKQPSSWAELSESVEPPALAELITISSDAWLLDPALPAATSPKQRTVRMLVPDVATDDASVGKVIKKLGGMVTVHELKPATPDGRQAIMLTGVVPAHSYDMLHSNLRLRIPTGIARVEQ